MQSLKHYVVKVFAVKLNKQRWYARGDSVFINKKEDFAKYFFIILVDLVNLSLFFIFLYQFFRRYLVVLVEKGKQSWVASVERWVSLVSSFQPPSRKFRLAWNGKVLWTVLFCIQQPVNRIGPHKIRLWIRSVGWALNYQFVHHSIFLKSIKRKVPMWNFLTMRFTPQWQFIWLHKMQSDEMCIGIGNCTTASKMERQTWNGSH